MPGEYLNLMERGEARERVICDYIAGMTDQYSMEKFSELFIPKSWQVR
jgi:dGTPase